MSMLSARCDELRELALWLDDEFYDVEAAKVRDAADTILELRDDLQRANAEYAKLRELVADVWRFTGAACKKYPRLFDPAAQGGQMVQLNALDSFEQRMRELGIEVPE